MHAILKKVDIHANAWSLLKAIYFIISKQRAISQV